MDKAYEQKWYGVKCYDSQNCTNYWMRSGEGVFFCYPAKMFAEEHAKEFNRTNDKYLIYVVEEVK